MKSTTLIAQVIGFLIVLAFANQIPTNYLLVILIGYVGLLVNFAYLAGSNVDKYIEKQKK